MYKVKDVIDIIRFNTSTLNELSGKAINVLFNNKRIVEQLNIALSEYANYTKAIEDIYSIPLETNTDYISAPELAIRSQSYRFALVWMQNQKYMLDSVDINKKENVFRYQSITGIPRWFTAWGDKIYISPFSSISYKTTTLNGNITKDDTTITLTDASNFLMYDGRITIDSEKILYQYISGNVLYNCIRGSENTTAVAHTSGVSVKENNLWLHYRRLIPKIVVYDNDFIDNETLNTIIDVPEDHILRITDFVSFRLLLKVDSERANAYKVEWSQWLDKAKNDVIVGRSIVKRTGQIRDPFIAEGDTYLPYNL